MSDSNPISVFQFFFLQVAPAELESVLLRHPAVEDVAVIGIDDERAGEVPMAYVKRKEGDIYFHY